MSASLDILDTNIFTALRSFLLSVLPADTSVIKGQGNRVSEPEGADFVVMTPMFKDRLAFNIDNLVEALFTGSITGTVLTISAVSAGALVVGSSIYGPHIAANTFITALGTGTGGVGTYTVNNSQTAASESIQAGTNTAQQFTKVTIQLDVHGPNSADNAQIITTLFWDNYAVLLFAQSGFDMAPLYTSDPRQIPFINGEQQYEDRYIIEVVLEANPIVTTPQQFAVALGPVQLYDVN